LLVKKDTKVYVALYGEDERLLYDELLNMPNASSGEYIFVKFPFEIRAAGEKGFLQVTTRDNNGCIDGAEYGAGLFILEWGQPDYPSGQYDL